MRSGDPIRLGCMEVGKQGLGYAEHAGQLVIDLSIVVVAVELPGVNTVGQHGHGQAGVAVRGEGDAGLVVDDVGEGDAQRLVGAVEHIFLLLVLAGSSAVDALLVGSAELFQLVVGEHQLIALLALGLEAEERLHILQDILKGGLVLLVPGHVVAVELGVGDLLALQQIQIGVVVGAGKADGEAAGFVVAGDQDQGLIGVLLGEVDGHLYCIGQGLRVVDGGGGVVGVAGPVDLAALARHKEAVLVLGEHLNSLFHVVGQGPHVVGAVDLVGHGVAVGQVLVDDYHRAAGDLLGLSLGLDHMIARLFRQGVQIGLISLGAGGLEQAAAGEVLKAGVDELQADVVVVITAGLVGIEGGRGGMVEVDGGNDAHRIALLGVELFGNGFVGNGAGFVHVDGAGVGLVAGGDGGGGGGGVGGKGVGVISHGGAGGLKVHEVEVLGTVQDGSAVVVQAGLGLPIVGVVQRTQEIGCGLDLGIAHAVANEEKHVFGGFDGGAGGGERLNLGGRRGGGIGRGGRGIAAGSQGHAQRQGGRGQGQGTLPIHSDSSKVILMRSVRCHDSG